MKMFKVCGKKILAGIGILVLLGLSAGCSDSERYSWERFKETHYRMVTGKAPKNTAKAANSKEGQVPGTQPGQQGTPVPGGKDAGNKAVPSKLNVTLYFADQNGDYLKAETREIQFVPGLARATVEELIMGPKTKGLARTMPEGTKLKDIDIKKGLCIVNLSKEFQDKHWGGSSGELLTVYSLVNTLTQFPAVEAVEILVEGQKIETLAGHLDLTVPVYRNSEIVKSK